MGLNWQALSERAEQRRNNIETLRTRDPALAEALSKYTPKQNPLFATDGQQVFVGREMDGHVWAQPNPVTPAGAADIVARLFPGGKCSEPAMIAGMDQGWLWLALHALEIDTPRAPGHRPPLYFLANDFERLWIALHLHDWTALLSDPRVQLFVGPAAVEQCQASMIANPQIPWPKLCVTVDPTIWPSGVSVDSMWQAAHAAANVKMQQLARKIDAIYAGTDAKTIIRKLRGDSLRVLGITSRFTTFLKHSMGDWMEAMQRLGHEARIIIEQADHEIANPLTHAQAVADFRPDIICMIDHYRAEIPGLPRQVPCVMWVQDQLPNIFNPKAGAAQGPRDYCLGFGRLHLRDHCGYPEDRFMPAQVGVNERRFVPRRLSDAESRQYTCDISFISHASTPATVLLAEQLNRADPLGRKLLIDIFEQMRAVYDGGGAISHASLIRGMIESAGQRIGRKLDTAVVDSVFDFFNHRINNALFRHQALTWAAELDLNLHLYGRGWEHHPRFARYARGVACNQTQIDAIYSASRINLQITPFGAVHQRMLDGLAAGGFFLVRYCAGDVVEPIYRRIYDWCQANDIGADDELRHSATPQIQALLERIRTLLGVDPFAIASNFMDMLRLSADGDYIRSAASIWSDYESISFGSKLQLQQRIARFLQDEPARRQIVSCMRQAVLDRLTYTATTRRLLEFIAADVERSVLPRQVAA